MITTEVNVDDDDDEILFSCISSLECTVYVHKNSRVFCIFEAFQILLCNHLTSSSELWLAGDRNRRQLSHDMWECNGSTTWPSWQRHGRARGFCLWSTAQLATYGWSVVSSSWNTICYYLISKMTCYVSVWKVARVVLLQAGSFSDTLWHVYTMNSRIDCCNTVLAGAQGQ